MIKNNRYYWSHLKTSNVTVRVAPKPKEKQNGIIFRVKNMIDLGNGRQTVTLEHVDYPQTYFKKRENKKDIPVPFRMGTLDFIYASNLKPAVRNVQSLLSTLYKEEKVEKIVTDVLSPGDLLVFKQEKDGMSIKMVDALRVVKEYSCHRSTANYAL
ncbi:MAG: hypothetical protein ACRBDI_03770 [Alphaproteobacteria bacterium]